MTEIRELLWPYDRLGDAITALARTGGLEPAPERLPEPTAMTPQQLTEWITAAGQLLEVEIERTILRHRDLPSELAAGRLLLARVPDGESSRFLAQVRPGVLLTPGMREQRVPQDAIRAAICGGIEAPAKENLGPVLDRAGLAGTDRARAERQLIRNQLALHPIVLWTCRTPVTAPWRKLFRQGPWLRSMIKLAVLQVLRLGAFLLAWRVIGQAVLTGRLEMGWLTAWALLLLTIVPLHMAGLWLQARFAIALGGLLKQRLLAGALRLDPETVLAMGAGQLLGKTMESSAVENLSLSGGFNGLIGLLELGAALAVFISAALVAPSLCLAVWLIFVAIMCRRYLARARIWTQTRISLTNALVERMVGHRTRLAQEDPSKWHEAEDQELGYYLAASQSRDRAEALLALVPQSWMVAGVASVAGTFLSDQASQTPLAAGLGAVLLANGAFRKLTGAAWQLMDAWIARDQIRDLAASAEIKEPSGSPSHANPPDGISAVEAQDVIYRYLGAEDPVLRRCSVRVGRGERVILEGPSGGGKSTLAAVMAGIRTPQSGLLLAGGLDRATIGSEGWRHRVALAPQFHQNHMITGPLSFNLLLGRPEPHTPSDQRDAEEICEELGLGPLLGRMPGGMAQVVGESGWQMSQGERSRVFLARALLQRADLVILDESFGALDPETRKMAVDCAIRRARSLLVIAHR